MTRFESVLLAALAISSAGCSNGGGAGSIFGEDAGSGAGGATDGSNAPGTTGSTTGNEGGSEDTSDSGGIKLDVAPGDGGGPGGDGDLPQTCEGAAAANSNAGCEFWAVDLPNSWDADWENSPNGVFKPIAEKQQFAVVVANTSTAGDAVVEVFLGASLTAIDTASVPPGEMHVFELPEHSVPPTEISTGIPAFRIESDLPITAYQFQPLDNKVYVYSNDASLLFPTHALTEDYTAISGDSILLKLTHEYNDNSGAFVSVVATEDDTHVDVYPTAELYPGDVRDVVLGRGEVFTVVSQGTGQTPSVAGEGNLSGSRIQSDKPVAVFSGNVCTREPAHDELYCCADHVEHQMLPLGAWGSRYVASPPVHPEGGPDAPAVFRITGAYDNTQLTYEPRAPDGAPLSIDAYETVAFQTKQAFSVTSGDPNRPFAVTEFLISAQAIHLSNRSGDPAMIVLPSVDQFRESYVFLTTEGYDHNYVTVVMPAGTQLTLDEESVDEYTVKMVGELEGIDYRYVHIPVDEGAHRLSATEPVGIVSTGYAEAVSYGYPGGSGLATISEPPPLPEG